MDNNLPKSWEECSISEYTEIIKAKGNEGEIPYLEIGDIDISTKKYELKDKPSVKGCKLSKKNDILISRVRPTRGAIAKINENEIFVSSAFTVIRLRESFEADNLFYQLAFNLDFLNFLGENCTGTMYPTVSEEIIGNYKINIPPLSEQQRIVSILDVLFEKIESNALRLEKIPKILKRFRQSIITSAVNGKLTEDWRKKNGIDEEWEEVELSSVIPKGGIFDGPFGSNLKTDDYTEKGIRVIRLENIEHLFFVHEKEKYVTEEKYQTLIRHTVGEGDIIFSSFISEEIRACILPKLSTKAIAKADCFCIRPDRNRIDKTFLLYTLISRRSYEQLVMNIHGATRPRINTTQLKTLQILLPKIKEQTEIVRRTEQLFAFADKIETRYTKTILGSCRE